MSHSSFMFTILAKAALAGAILLIVFELATAGAKGIAAKLTPSKEAYPTAWFARLRGQPQWVYPTGKGFQGETTYRKFETTQFARGILNKEDVMYINENQRDIVATAREHKQATRTNLTFKETVDRIEKIEREDLQRRVAAHEILPSDVDRIVAQDLQRFKTTIKHVKEDDTVLSVVEVTGGRSIWDIFGSFGRSLMSTFGLTNSDTDPLTEIITVNMISSIMASHGPPAVVDVQWNDDLETYQLSVTSDPVVPFIKRMRDGGDESRRSRAGILTMTPYGASQWAAINDECNVFYQAPNGCFVYKLPPEIDDAGNRTLIEQLAKGSTLILHVMDDLSHDIVSFRAPPIAVALRGSLSLFGLTYAWRNRTVHAFVGPANGYLLSYADVQAILGAEYTRLVPGFSLDTGISVPAVASPGTFDGSYRALIALKRPLFPVATSTDPPENIAPWLATHGVWDELVEGIAVAKSTTLDFSTTTKEDVDAAIRAAENPQNQLNDSTLVRPRFIVRPPVAQPGVSAVQFPQGPLPFPLDRMVDVGQFSKDGPGENIAATLANSQVGWITGRTINIPFETLLSSGPERTVPAIRPSYCLILKPDRGFNAGVLVKSSFRVVAHHYFDPSEDGAQSLAKAYELAPVIQWLKLQIELATQERGIGEQQVGFGFSRKLAVAALVIPRSDTTMRVSSPYVELVEFDPDDKYMFFTDDQLQYWREEVLDCNPWTCTDAGVIPWTLRFTPVVNSDGRQCFLTTSGTGMDRIFTGVLPDGDVTDLEEGLLVIRFNGFTGRTDIVRVPAERMLSGFGFVCVGLTTWAYPITTDPGTAVKGPGVALSHIEAESLWFPVPLLNMLIRPWSIAQTGNWAKYPPIKSATSTEQGGLLDFSLSRGNYPAGTEPKVGSFVLTPLLQREDPWKPTWRFVKHGFQQRRDVIQFSFNLTVGLWDDHWIQPDRLNANQIFAIQWPVPQVDGLRLASNTDDPLCPPVFAVNNINAGSSLCYLLWVFFPEYGFFKQLYMRRTSFKAGWGAALVEGFWHYDSTASPTRTKAWCLVPAFGTTQIGPVSRNNMVSSAVIGVFGIDGKPQAFDGDTFGLSGPPNSNLIAGWFDSFRDYWPSSWPTDFLAWKKEDDLLKAAEAARNRGTR